MSIKKCNFYCRQKKLARVSDLEMLTLLVSQQQLDITHVILSAHMPLAATSTYTIRGKVLYKNMSCKISDLQSNIFYLVAK